MKLVPLALLAALAGCTASGARFEPTPTSVRSDAADAKGYVIIGFADENAGLQMFHALTSFAVLLRRDDGAAGSMAAHDSCSTYAGLGRDGACVSDDKLDYRVLQVTPGAWALTGIVEIIREGFPSRTLYVSANLPPGLAFKVKPGQVVYIGDFLFTVDTETRSAVLKHYSHDAAAAMRALARYPALVGPIDDVDMTPPS